MREAQGGALLRQRRAGLGLCGKVGQVRWGWCRAVHTRGKCLSRPCSSLQASSLEGDSHFSQPQAVLGSPEERGRGGWRPFCDVGLPGPVPWKACLSRMGAPRMPGPGLAPSSQASPAPGPPPCSAPEQRLPGCRRRWRCPTQSALGPGPMKGKHHFQGEVGSGSERGSRTPPLGS